MKEQVRNLGLDFVMFVLSAPQNAIYGSAQFHERYQYDLLIPEVLSLIGKDLTHPFRYHALPIYSVDLW